MPSYFVIAILGLPFVGLYLLSQGGYAISVGKVGYDNGSIIPYSIFFISFALSLFFFKRKSLSLRKQLSVFPVQNPFLKNVSFIVFFINFLTLFLFFFVWGSISIFTSDLGRGEFRASISSGVFFYYWLMKIISPGVFLYYTICYLRASPNSLNSLFYKFNFFLLFLIGVSTGFKTTFITLILPVVFFIFWDSSLKVFVRISFYIIFVIFFVYYVVSRESDSELIFDLLVQRLFIAQADVSWYVWDMYTSGEAFPNYFKSLLSVFGGNFVYLVTGVDRSNLANWIYYDYNSLINVIAGLPVSVVEEGHNIVGTIFSESLIAFGLPGLVIFPFFGGWFIAFILNSIQEMVLKGNFIVATILLTYFSIFVLGWVTGGGISTIFHISLFFGFLVLFFLLNLMSFLSKRIRFSHA